MSKDGKHLFTSESVTEGHPDKICDQISDAILDDLLGQDPLSRVACETLVTTGLVLIAGEITSRGYTELQKLVRDTVKDLSIEERIDGKQGLRMFVMKQSGANTVKITREINKQLAELEKSLPPDVRITTIFDTSDFIIGAIRNLSQTLMWALVFVILVVLVFLGR